MIHVHHMIFRVKQLHSHGLRLESSLYQVYKQIFVQLCSKNYKKLFHLYHYFGFIRNLKVVIHVLVHCQPLSITQIKFKIMRFSFNSQVCQEKIRIYHVFVTLIIRSVVQKKEFIWNLIFLADNKGPLLMFFIACSVGILRISVNINVANDACLHVLLYS